MTAPRVYVDDVNVCPNVALIPYSMLKLVDPKNQLLVQYLASIDSSTTTGVIPPKVYQKGEEGTMKDSKATKKKKKVEKPQIIEVEINKETTQKNLGS